MPRWRRPTRCPLAAPVTTTPPCRQRLRRTEAQIKHDGRRAEDTVAGARGDSTARRRRCIGGSHDTRGVSSGKQIKPGY
uniref:Uncharacterized protein n=1 Tax=Setaria italica TaxID=4555 RepID=K4AHH7_SETIT